MKPYFIILYCIAIVFLGAMGDTVNVSWLSVSGAPTAEITGTINENYFIDFESVEAVNGGKFIYEIIKA